MAAIQPGLDRIRQLLKGVDFPWRAVHVAGTNGKGSVCSMTAHLLTRRHVKCGTFMSPHLVDRVETHYQALNGRESVGASPFEILTATAFTIFNEQQVRIGVVEVGMGGKLDATNILNNQVISVINKIARDHQEFLGQSLPEIALHKAGILRPSVPYLLNPFNDKDVQDVINQHASEIGAGPRIAIDTLDRRVEMFSRKLWHNFAHSLAPFQRDNAVLGIIAAQEAVRGLGEVFEHARVLRKLPWVANQHHLGRQQWVKVEPIFGTPGRAIFVDGAHNPDAAEVLRSLIHSRPERRQRRRDEDSIEDNPRHITWVIAMSEGKNALGYLRSLLRPGDIVVTTSFEPVDGMPWVKSMDPGNLLEIAKSAQDRITGIHIPEKGAVRALYAASLLSEPSTTIVLTGSLYLAGDLYRELRKQKTSLMWTDEQRVKIREMYGTIKKEERKRFKNATSAPKDHNLLSLAET